MNRREVINSVAGQLLSLENTTVIVIVRSRADEVIVGRHLRNEMQCNFGIFENKEFDFYITHPLTIRFANNSNKLILVNIFELKRGLKLLSLGCDPDQYPIWHVTQYDPQRLGDMTCHEIDHDLYAREFIKKYDEENERLNLFMEHG